MRITENKKKETEKEMRKKTEQMKRVIENRKREKEKKRRMKIELMMRLTTYHQSSDMQ